MKYYVISRDTRETIMSTTDKAKAERMVAHSPELYYMVSSKEPLK